MNAKRCRVRQLVVVAGLALLSTVPALAADLRTEFDETDTNHDGVIDRDEYRKRMIEVFYFADKNKDGMVELEEIVQTEPNHEAQFKAADKNHDNRLDMAEFVEFRMADFDEADTDHSGTVSYEEAEDWFKTHRPAGTKVTP